MHAGSGAREEARVKPTEIAPENTVFVILSFEGPDQYSKAGGLGVRVAELSEALAERGYETHLLFVGDPSLPGHEIHRDGTLHLHRWCQWISRYFPAGVYQGETEKLYDFNESVPRFILEEIVRPASNQGKIVAILGEEWHTAETVCRISDLLYFHGLRDSAIQFWNANNSYGFDLIDWSRLTYTNTITTVSRYMKHLMWDRNTDPLVIPNGIPSRAVAPVDEEAVVRVRATLAGDLLLFKIGRFDPDKRWVVAIEAAAKLKQMGLKLAFPLRGGHEPFGLVGLEVMGAGGLAFTGSTGEDYTIPFENAVVLDTSDPGEIVGYLTYLRNHPAEREEIRRNGYRTAHTFLWANVIKILRSKLEYIARNQGILDAADTGS